MCTDSERTALQNKTEDIKLRNGSADLSPLQRQKDNEDLEDDSVHFSTTHRALMNTKVKWHRSRY